MRTVVSKRNKRLYKMFSAENALRAADANVMDAGIGGEEASPDDSGLSVLGALVIIAIIVLNSLLLSGCGFHADTAPPAAPSCTVSALPSGSGAVIECPDGTTQVVTNGVDGAGGSQGLPGINGQPCTVTPTAAGALIACPDGTSQTITNGADGQNVTPVAVVQFCDPSFVPSYPSVFPEVGFVIGGTLYAVYSANGGFLAPLPPGTYSSNGIGASCTFTVNADNSISR